MGNRSSSKQHEEIRKGSFRERVDGFIFLAAMNAFLLIALYIIASAFGGAG